MRANINLLALVTPMPEASVSNRKARLRRTGDEAGAARSAPGRTQPRPRSLLAILVGMVFMRGPQVHAVELGEIVSRSSLDEPFAVRIPLQLDSGEEFTSACVNILPGPDASRGVPLPPGLRASIEIVSGRSYLAIRNSRPANDPVVGLRLEFTCYDLHAKDYVVFLDPAEQEPAAAQPAPTAIVQARPGHEMPAPRPRQRRTVAKVHRAKHPEEPQRSERMPS